MPKSVYSVKNKKKAASAGTIIEFDEASRREFVTGFRKRKNERRKIAMEQNLKKEKEQRIKERAERRAEMAKLMESGLTGLEKRRQKADDEEYEWKKKLDEKAAEESGDVEENEAEETGENEENEEEGGVIEEETFTTDDPSTIVRVTTSVVNNESDDDSKPTLTALESAKLKLQAMAKLKMKEKGIKKTTSSKKPVLKAKSKKSKKGKPMEGKGPAKNGPKHTWNRTASIRAYKKARKQKKRK